MIHELVILSGKGGTGKTSIAASLAHLAGRSVIADCDVDAANLHILLKPEIEERFEFSDGKKAYIQNGLCVECGDCVIYCRYHAIEDFYVVNEHSCEGCSVCAELCPYGAIEMRDHTSGEWYISKTVHGPMVHARLGIAEGNSGKLVSLIRKKAREIAEEQKEKLILVDGSPGIGCPVIATVTGASSVLIVTEPSVAGLHDLKRLNELISRFNIPAYLCLNKADINRSIADEIQTYCADNSIELIGSIPYDDDFVKAVISGSPLVSVSDGPSAGAIRDLWQRLQKLINT